MNSLYGTSKDIGENNIYAIFKLIYKNQPITRKELANTSSYSAATISNHVNHLIEMGFVTESKKGSSTGGRKPVNLEIISEKGYMLTINIEVDQVNIKLLNIKYEIVEEIIIEELYKNDVSRSLIKIFQEIKRILNHNPRFKDKLLGTGISVPGLINKESGKLVFAPNLTWENVPILDEFKAEFPDTPLFLENEAKASAIAEKTFAYPEIENMVFISVNQGIGCGIIFNGKLIRGATGNCGEYGHLKVTENGRRCHCGRQGCWETEASELFIYNKFNQEVREEKKYSQEEIYNLIAENHPLAVKISNLAADGLGKGVANVINSLNPELIVIGGGIIRIKEHISERFKQVVSRQALDLLWNSTEIAFSDLGKESANLGMAWIVREHGIISQLKF